MKQVFTDPDRLERFAHALKVSSRVIQENSSRIQAGLSRLGESWRDQQYREFVASFSSLQKVLQEFVVEVEVVIPSLLQEAEIIRKFQQHLVD